MFEYKTSANLHIVPLLEGTKDTIISNLAAFSLNFKSIPEKNF